MGCAAGTFQNRCRNPACSYTPDAQADHGYCCSNCQKLHDGSWLWEVKTDINTKSSNEDIKGHSQSQALEKQLCRMHLQGYWQDLGTEERKSFVYLALVRNGKELHCRRINGKEPVPRQGSHFDIWLDRGMVLVQDAKVGDHFELKYQVGKQCRLLVSGVSIAMVPRELESLEHETECLQVTAKIPTTGPCRNPICSYVAQSGGFCCVACQKMKEATRRCGLRNIRTLTESDGFQSAAGVVALNAAATGMIHFHCWWRSADPKASLKLCLLRKKTEVASATLSNDDAPADWQLLQKVFEKDDELIQETQEGDELQVQYNVAGKLEVKQITISVCPFEFSRDVTCCHFPAKGRKAPGGVSL